MEDIVELLGAVTIGFGGGLLLGLAGRRGGFCTRGAIEDALYGGDLRRLRMWALALAVAIAGTFLLADAGLTDPAQSIYATNAWNPLASIFGGLVFGYGMAIAGNCGYGALTRLGGGDLRSFVIVVVMGIAAYMTMGGPLGPLREALFPTVFRDAAEAESSGLANLLAGGLGIAPLVPALIIAALMAVVALASREFRASREHWFWSLGVGVAILSGWLGTTWIAERSFDPVAIESHTFTAPLGETIIYFMTATGGGISFSVGSVLGVVAGALIGSISQGHFRWEACDDPGELGRQILGGFLMGIGGVVALGCSVGQGLTAFSMLAYSAPVVLASIFFGAWFGLAQLIRGFAPAE